jgi:Xaa-Pro aminopeptidase
LNGRVDALRRSLEEPRHVTSGTNVRYLTGFDSSNAALLVEQDDLTLFADFRYAAAGRAVEGVRFVETKRSLAAALAEQLSGRIGFEADAVVYAAYETLAAGGLELVPRRGLVEALRAVKDEDEIDSIRRASEVTTKAFEQLAEEPFLGRSERELAWRLEILLHEHGGEGLAFDIGLGAGANGALPHAHPSDRLVAEGDLVVVDAGAVVDGYCSDCTRTFAAGTPPPDLAQAYAVCLEAQLAALEAVRPGLTGVEAHSAARGVIEEAGFGGAFGHGLGHGVGLLIHEAPRLSTESSDTLAAGNVFSVEPGIYLEGAGGIRIEDLVVLRDEGPEILTGFTKELVQVG